MDESQESTKTISAAKFFDKIEYVAQIANDALATSTALQSELSRVQIDLKSLIESLQVNFDSGVQNIQNQINEVTNVIIQEQDTRKSETEALEQQIFAQEDQLQKNVKGKKAKKVAPDAFAGKMRQKLREKAEKNSGILGAGLGLGLGMGLMGGGNWFTNLLPENPFKNNDNKDDGDGENNNTEFSEENPPEGLRRVLTGMVDFVMFGTTDMDFKGDLFGGDEENTNGDDEEITEGINTYEDIKKGFIQKTFFPSLSDLKETFQMITGQNIYNQFFPNDKGLLNMFNNKKENGDEISSNKNNKQIIETNDSISSDLSTITVDGVTYPRGLPGLGYNPFGVEGGSTYGDSRFNPYAFISSDTNTTDNNSNGGDEVIDGGTTVIEGGTQVVDGGTVGNNQRGEVMAQFDIVKSANSPVAAITISENNSIKELVIGA